MNKSIITTIIVIIAIVIAGGIYFWMIGDRTPDGGVALLSSSGGFTDTNIGSDELALLGQVQNININPAFFSSDMFKSLEDMVQPVPTADMFRENPFAPVPGLWSPFAIQQSQAR